MNLKAHLWRVARILGGISFVLLLAVALWFLFAFWVGTGWHNQ
jgi:hypothetical protein